MVLFSSLSLFHNFHYLSLSVFLLSLLQWHGGLISFCGGGVEVVSLFMGFWRLGWIWVAFRWLDLGSVVVIFSDGLGDLFWWVWWWFSVFARFVWYWVSMNMMMRKSWWEQMGLGWIETATVEVGDGNSGGSDGLKTGSVAV